MVALDVLAAQSAAKAVGGLAVRASAPLWKAALAKLRPAPAAVRRMSAWSETKRVRNARQAIAKYLDGRVCLGLLEILAVLEAAPDEGDRLAEKAELAGAFRRELGRNLDLPEDQVTDIADALWADLGDCVRLHVAELRAADVFAAPDLAYVSELVGLLGQGATGGPLARLVAERAAVSVDNDRVRQAQGAVQVIRHAQHERYAKLVMPHSREDYLVPIEQLYVPRVLQAVAQGEDVGEEVVPERRFVVIGNPGAGKSTFIRHLLYRTAIDTDDQRAPLVIELKDHQVPHDSFVIALTDRLRLMTQAELDSRTVRDLLLLGLAIVVFDGLDEIADLDHRRQTAAAIQAFARRYPLVRIVVTAREEGFVTARLDPESFPVHRLPDFNDDQVELYVNQWFAIAGRGPGGAEPGLLAHRFLADSIHVADLRTNPLMLSLLCLIYRYEGYIPENRPEVYEECAHLLFERWDKVRRVPIPVNRTLQTKYLVQELGYYFFNREVRLGGETEAKLRLIISDYFERNIVGGVETARQQAQDFLDYCAGRAWLLTRISTSERGERVFGFTHRTFMEYYAARYIVRRCRDATALVTMIKPMVLMGTSEVVPQIAMQQFDDKNDRGADDCFLLLLFDGNIAQADRRTLLEFALRTLRYMRPSAKTVSRIFVAALIEFGRTVDVTIAALLLSTPVDTHDLLALVCARRGPFHEEESIEAGYGPSGPDVVRRRQVTDRQTEDQARRLGATLISVLLASRGLGVTAVDIAERLHLSDAALANYLRDRTALLHRTEPEVLSALTERGLLSLERFIALAGVRTVVDDGLLTQRLADFFVRETERPDLRPMLAAVYGDVRTVLRLGAEVTAGLLSATGHTAIGADGLDAEFGQFVPRLIERHFPIQGGKPAVDSLGLRVVYLAVLCAAYDFEREGLPWPSDRSWRDLAAVLPGLADALRESSAQFDGVPSLRRTELSALILQHVRTGRYAQRWVDVFIRWADGHAVFCADQPR